MNESIIKLEKIYFSGDSVHVKLLINDKDCGILYLNTDEAELLLKSLKFGVGRTESELESNIFEDEDDFDVEDDN